MNPLSMHAMCEDPFRVWPPWMMHHALLWAPGPGPPWVGPSARAEPLEAYLSYPASYPLRCMPQRQCVLHSSACLIIAASPQINAMSCLHISALSHNDASPYMMSCLTRFLPSYQWRKTVERDSRHPASPQPTPRAPGWAAAHSKAVLTPPLISLALFSTPPGRDGPCCMYLCALPQALQGFLAHAVPT